MLCAKREYDCNVIINYYLGFYDLKSKKRYNFFVGSSKKLQFSSQACEFKAIFTFTKSIYTCNVFKANKFKANESILGNFFLSSFNLIHSSQHRQTDICTDYLKVIIFWQKRFVKDEVYKFLVRGIKKLSRDSRITKH